MKNKIALCFSGDLRTFDICVDNIITNIINPLKGEFDVSQFSDVKYQPTKIDKIEFVPSLSKSEYLKKIKQGSDVENNDGKLILNKQMRLT